MKNQKYKLSGKNIYRDARGRAIYYVPKEKRAYQIKENQEGLFQTLQLRYYLVFVIGLLIYFTIVPNLLISIFVLGTPQSYKVKLTPNTKLRDDGYAPLSVPLATSGS